MGSHKKGIKPPPDPDPRPGFVSDSTADIQNAKREEQKKNRQAYGRHQTVLAGVLGNSQINENKKTVLGG